MKRKKSFKNKFNLLLLLMILITAACAQKLDPEEPCNFVQNSQLQRVSWKGQIPIVLYIDPSVPEEYHEAVRKSASEWNYKMNRFLFDVRTESNSSTTTAPSKDGTSRIHWLTEWDDSKSLEQARTTIFWKGDQITEADIRINARDFQFSALDTTPVDKVDFESLLTHEYGHVLGLQHTEKGNNSVMEPQLAHGQERRVPGQFDLESLKCEY